MPWSDIAEVAIRTTSDGPFAEDVFWVFVRYDGTCFEVPGVLVGSEDLGAMQNALPGLDNRKIIRAMTSTRERVFRVWHHAEPAVDDKSLGERFDALVVRLGGQTRAGLRDLLLAAWNEPARCYHTTEHLADCLRELPANDIAELALFYHDVVYVPGASDNETRSAAWLRKDARELGLPEESVKAAEACILATAHLEATPANATEALVVDTDLAILARSPLRVADYACAIAEEYTGVMLFSFGRRRFLKRLLAQPKLFHTMTQHEAPARRAIERLLAR